MPDAIYRLLYQIDAPNLSELDKLVQSQGKVSAASQFGAQQISQFEQILRSTAASGKNYSQALNEIAKSTDSTAKAYSNIAKTILENNRVQEEATRVAEREAEKRIRIAEREAEQREKANVQSLKNLNVLAGVRDSVAVDSLIGRTGGAAAVPALAALGAGSVAFNLVKDAANQARELQNLANEFGITAQAAFKLDAAAKLSGESLSGLSRMAVKLDEALQNPATTGKKTADELVKLGVDLRTDMGGALQQVLERLSQIDNAGKRSAEAILLFGRNGAAIAEVAGNLKEVSQTLDTSVQSKLLEAQKNIANFSNSFTILEGVAASALFSIEKALDNLSKSPAFAASSPLGLLLAGGRYAFEKLSSGPPTFVPAGTGNHFPVPSGIAGADRIANRYQDQGLALDERIAAARKSAVVERGTYERLKATAQGGSGFVSNDQLIAEAKKVSDLEQAYKKLADQKKNANKAPGIENRFDAEMRRFDAEAYKAQYPSSIYGHIPELQTQLTQQLGEINKRDSGFTASQRNILAARARAANNRAIIEEARELGNRNAADRMKSDAIGNAFNDFAPGYAAKQLDSFYRDDLKESLDGSDRRFAADREISGINSRANLEGLKRSIGFQQTLATLSNQGRETPGTIGQGLQSQLQIIQAETAQRKQDLESSQDLYNAEQKRVELVKIEADTRKASADAEIEATERVIQLRQENLQRNKEETGNFLSGLVNAGIDGNVGGFFKQQGRGMLSTIVGNFGKNLPFTLNSAASLGKTGVLGTEDNPSFFGKLLAGTPFGIDKSGGANSLQSATSSNTQATIDNTNTLRALLGVTPLPGGSSTGTIATSSGGASLPFSSGGGAFGGLLSGIPGLSSPTTAPFLPSYLTNPGDGLPIGLGPQLSLPNLGGGGGGAVSGISSAIGKLLGGAGAITSGNALGAIFNGSYDNGNGVGTALSGLGRIGAAAGLAGTEATGIMSALKGFGQGGARGDIKGLTGILGAAAPLSGPLAPFLGAGAGILGLIGSLFPDARQARQKAEQQTVTHDAFVQPSSQDIFASYGGAGAGGFNMGEGGGVRSASQISQAPIVHLNVQAWDAQSVTNWAMNNPDAASSVLLYGMGGSSAAAFSNEMQIRNPSGGWQS